MHHEGCGCHQGHGMGMKRKKTCAMIFFGFMALVFAMIAGMLHLKLHMMDE